MRDHPESCATVGQTFVNAYQRVIRPRRRLGRHSIYGGGPKVRKSGEGDVQSDEPWYSTSRTYSEQTRE